MTVQRMAALVKRTRWAENDRRWFPKLVRECATFLASPPEWNLERHRDAITGYLRKIKAYGRRPWQRLQAVRAIDLQSFTGRRP